MAKAELNQQNNDSSNVNEDEKRRIQFVISGTYGEPATCAAELLSSLGESRFKAIRKKCLFACRNIYVAVLVIFVLIISFIL